MPIFETDTGTLQQSHAKNIKLNVNKTVINIVQVEFKAQISEIWQCKVSFTTNEKQNSYL